MGQYKKLWYALIAVLIVTFSILGYLGTEVYRQAPPFPDKYVTASGETVITKEDILAGQSAWQSTGGMEVGSVMGHGAFQAPDWTADWLHREAEAWLNISAEEKFQKKYADLGKPEQASLLAALREEYRNQSQPREDGTVVLSETRLKAIKAITPYYLSVYGDDPAFEKTRESFAMKTTRCPTHKPATS